MPADLSSVLTSVVPQLRLGLNRKRPLSLAVSTSGYTHSTHRVANRQKSLHQSHVLCHSDHAIGDLACASQVGRTELFLRLIRTNTLVNYLSCHMGLQVCGLVQISATQTILAETHCTAVATWPQIDGVTVLR